MSVMQAEAYEIETEEFEPEGELELIKFRLIGKTMLLMKNNAGVNPLNELVKQKSVLTSLRPKQRTDEDIWEIYRLDFVLSMYHDSDIGPYIPGVNLEAAMLEAAKYERLGSKFKAGVRIVDDKVPLEYKGPRDIAKLWESKKFADIRPTKLKASTSLMTCRPCFSDWSLTATAGYNGSIVDRAAVERCIAKIGAIGICDYRKRYGKSHVQLV